MKQHHISVTVSKTQFAKNIQILKKHVSPAQLSVVMKADAYGHGLANLAETAISAGADYIAICTNPEAHIIRAVSKDIRLIRIRMALPEELDESMEELNIEEEVGTWEVAEYLSHAGERRGEPVPIHLKLDTGMGRGGFDFGELETMRDVIALPGLRIVGVMTHFANADDKLLDHTLFSQMQAFAHFAETLKPELPDDVIFHTHHSTLKTYLA